MSKNSLEVIVKGILKELLDKEFVTINELCVVLNISDKTIRNRIKDINDILVNKSLGEIMSRQGKGIWLESNSENRIVISQMINENTEIDIYTSNKSRIFNILKLILSGSNSRRITTSVIAENLYLSQPTVIKVIQEVKEWLLQFDVELEYSKSNGYSLSANEASYRIAVKHFITRLGEKKDLEKNINFLMPKVDIDGLKKNIIKTEKQWQLEFAEESYTDVLVYLSLAISRRRKGNKVNVDNEELKLLESYSEYDFAKSLFSLCEKYLDEYDDKNEIGFLSIQILCSKILDSDTVIDTHKILIDFNNKLNEFIEKIILVVSNVLNVDISNDDDLRRGLLMHLRPCIFRLRYERGQNSKLTKLIKNEYQGTFRISWIVSVLFEEYFGLKVTEDELSYIVIYIQTALERNSSPVTALLVTSSGMGINQMLSEKIKRTFSKIKTVRVISFHDFNPKRESECDIVITTNELPQSKKMVRIDEMLTESSIQEINKKIDEILDIGSESSRFDVICHSLFEPDLIFCNLTINNQEEAITIMCNELVRKGYVTKKYYQTVIDREAKNPTAIGNYCATPHGDQNEINESKVCLATLANPIEWDTEKVSLIFLLVVRTNNPFEIKKTQLFCKQYLNLVETLDKVNEIRKLNSNIEIFKYLVK